MISVQCSVDSNQCSVDSSILPSDEHSSSEEEEQLPTLPDYLFGQLPDFFKRVVERADSKEERDMLLLASIVALGSGLTTFSGIYDGNQVFPTLFFYIAARASSGKGRLVMCRNLVDPIHWEKRKQSAQENLLYEVEMREYNLIKSKDVAAEKPPKPPVRLHILPANNTTAGLLQLLADNNGEGLIIETEGDTMAKALKSEISDFSDFLRKDYHHEMISAYRKTDHEYQNIEQPRFNMILSSTFGQLRSLIPSTENGLLSRFMFYYMNLKPIWKDVFEHSNKKPLAEHFNELGQEFFHLYTTLRAKDPIRFALREDQQKEFNAFFARMQDKYLVLQGLDYVAIIRRLGLMAFRIMMILTAMRIPETGDFSTCQQCNDEDFQTSLSIIKVMVLHASYIVSQLPTEEKTEKRGNKKSKFYEGLGERFTTKDFVELAKGFSIPERTAKRYVALFCDKHLICREDTGIYSKSNQKEQQRY